MRTAAVPVPLRSPHHTHPRDQIRLQVKNDFKDQPAVYNEFLDIMKEFKRQT
jgi:hypothetical protein